MSFHRSVFVALATVFTVGMAPAAFAQCCGYQAPAPVYYAPASGCGGCGHAYAAPAYARRLRLMRRNCLRSDRLCNADGAGADRCRLRLRRLRHADCCGHVHLQVAPTPDRVAAAAAADSPAVYNAPAPIYVVNQGPDFSGPGVMVPYGTYAPPAQYAAASVLSAVYRPHAYYRGGAAGYYRGGQGYYRQRIIVRMRTTVNGLTRTAIGAAKSGFADHDCKGPLRRAFVFYRLESVKRLRCSRYKAPAQLRSRH